MSHRDSGTREAAAKRVPKGVEGAPSNFKYIFGGKAYKRKVNGIRKHQRLSYVMVF
uniref:Uncharacterized protein n=1 Tax=Amphimedon queenslandica TaxID=400682 RepID=A0A1X7TRX1_AMPQE